MTSAKRKGRRRWLRRFLWGAAGLVVLAGLAVSGLRWRLHQGPIRIDFLEPQIEKALDDLVSPVSVKLGGTTLEWVGGGRPVEIQANDVRLLTPDGGELASFAGIGVGRKLSRATVAIVMCPSARWVLSGSRHALNPNV